MKMYTDSAEDIVLYLTSLLPEDIRDWVTIQLEFTIDPKEMRKILVCSFKALESK